MQTTLLGLAIAFIIALIATLVGPYFIDWNQFRPQFEAEASRVLGAPVRIHGALDARLLPTPSLRLRSVVVGAGGPTKLGADKLDVEFSLGSLMRGEWRATELTINGMAFDLGLDAQSRLEWPASAAGFNLASSAIDRLNLTGRLALHDAASRSTLQLTDIAFSGDVRSLAGSLRGDGNFVMSGVRYPFRLSSGQTADGNGTRVHLSLDPGARGRAVDLDGVLGFEARAPRFDGTVTLAGIGAKAAAATGELPWRLAAKLKADPASARLEQLEASYGADETGLKLSGSAEVRFGASPMLRAVLSARQFDADKLLGRDNEPTRWLPGLRNLLAALVPAPLASQVAISAEQIILAGRPVQNFAADVHGDSASWTVDRLEFRAPGATRVALSGELAQPGPSGSFKGAFSVDSADPNALASWLQGRSEVAMRATKTLRASGQLNVTADLLLIDGLKADTDAGTLQGRIAVMNPAAQPRLEAALTADRLDLDTATAVARALVGSQAEWPERAQLSLDIGRAVSAGQELRPFAIKLSYGPDSIALDRLKIGDIGGVMMEGAGSFDRAGSTGRLALKLSAASFAQLNGLIAPVAPMLAERLNALAILPGRSQLALSLELDKNPAQAERANARARLDVSVPQFKAVTTITAAPAISALHGLDLEGLRSGTFQFDTKLSAEQGLPLLALLGLDRVVAAAPGPAQFEGSATGNWRAPWQLKARLWGGELDAEAQGIVEPWSGEPQAVVNLSIRQANLAPLLDIGQSTAQNVSLSSRLSLAGSKLTFNDVDSVVGGARIRGRLALDLGEAKSLDGEVGMDALELAPAFAVLVGAAGHDAAEPLGRGLLQGWRSRVAFQALRGALPGGSELRPISGMVKSDGQSVTFDDLKGTIGGGEASATVEAKQATHGVMLNARLQFAQVDGEALRYRALTMPKGRVSMRMTLASQGRSASALAGALSGNGLLTLQSADIAGLDPRAFDVAIRASDTGQATDDVKLRRIVEPALSSGSLAVASAQIPFDIRDGRLRVGATTLEAEGARAIVSGGYDIAADQADIRAALSTGGGSATGRPEIQIFAAGPPDALDRSVDVAALSAWLAVRAIDRETRRLDALERGETPPPALPASLPPPVPATPQPPSEATGNALPDLPISEVPVPSRDPRRVIPKPKLTVPPAAAPPSSNPSVAGQQAAPLPPPIEIRPAPGAAAKPKPRPPLVLTPPVQNAPRSF